MNPMNPADFAVVIKEANQRAQNTIHPQFYVRFALDRTGSQKEAEEVERNVMLSTQFILLLDRYYETRHIKYQVTAKEVGRQLWENLSPVEKEKFKDRYQAIGSFWAYEKSLMRKRSFQKKDRVIYLHRKSSDVFLYTLVAGFVEPFPPGIVRAFHAMQQLNDIEDDFADMSEDRETHSPNLIFLFSREYRSPQDLKPDERTEISEVAQRLLRRARRYPKEVPYLCSQAELYYESIVRTLQ